MWAQIVPDARNSQYAADFKKTLIQTVRGLMRQRREKPRSLRPAPDLAPHSHGGADSYCSQKAPQAPKPGRQPETPPGLGGRRESEGPGEDPVGPVPPQGSFHPSVIAAGKAHSVQPVLLFFRNGNLNFRVHCLISKCW